MKIEKNSKVLNLNLIGEVLDQRHNTTWFNFIDFENQEDIKDFEEEDINLIKSFFGSESITDIIYCNGLVCDKNQQFIFNVEVEIFNNEIIRESYYPIKRIK